MILTVEQSYGKCSLNIYEKISYIYRSVPLNRRSLPLCIKLKNAAMMMEKANSMAKFL